MPCATPGPPARRYLFRRPKALQCFHNGELRKASDEERQAGRFELFLDLLCVFAMMERKSDADVW